VSVVSGEHDGKRSYLFEGGEERTISAASLALMVRVERPDRDQQQAYARLTALLSKRADRDKAPKPVPATIAPQLRAFRERHPRGLLDEAWLNDRDRQQARAAFDAAGEQARETLSQKNLDAALKLEHFEPIWKNAFDALTASGLADLAPVDRPVAGEQLAALAKSIRKLLHASGSYEHRFDGFVAALDGAFRGPPSWELATALPALIFPTEHVCVEPGLFRRQLKLLSRSATLAPRPNGTAYGRCAATARTIARELALEGEIPRDLFDVVGFARATVTGRLGR
jgi:hypothetical protein